MYYKKLGESKVIDKIFYLHHRRYSFSKFKNMSLSGFNILLSFEKSIVRAVSEQAVSLYCRKKVIKPIFACNIPNLSPIQCRGPWPKLRNVAECRFCISLKENRAGSNVSG